MAPTPASLHGLLDGLAAASPHVTAAVSWAPPARSALTYAAVRDRSEALGEQLLRCAAGCAEPAAPAAGAARPTLALHVPRTHPDFLPLLVAASRAALPLVLLSTDLPDKRLEHARNVWAVRAMRPGLLVTTSRPAAEAALAEAAQADAEAPTRGTRVLSLEELEAAPHGVPPAVPDCRTLCYMFTGGTQRTKIVEVTHAMLLHENRAYGGLWRPRAHPAVVLGHTSVYWGASALGQLSIALAFAGTVVWAEVTEVDDLRRCISEEGVTVLGVVPDHLDLLAPQVPATDLPSVEVVFTWGERLPRRLAERWRGHPRAVVRELLIATEYWLALWTDPIAGEGVLRAVEGAEALVLSEDGSPVAAGEVGELCLAGPMVTPGYVRQAAPGGAGDGADVFCADAAGRRFFRTRDLVRRVPGGVVYKGRADMMTKSKGKWVDMLAVEDEVARLPGVAAAKALPDPVLEHFHLFLKLEDSGEVNRVLDSARLAVPPQVQLWHVPDLPRHPVTRKVDSARLLKMVTSCVPSWPISGDPRLSAAPLGTRERLAAKATRQLAFTCTSFGVAWALADGRRLLPQLTVAAAALAGGSSLLTEDSEAAAATLACAWTTAALLLGRWDLQGLLLGARSVGIFTYGWIALMVADDARGRSGVARRVMAVVDELPLWKLGSFVLLSLAQHLPRPLGSVSFGALAAGGAFGLVNAVRRGRLVAWPLVFWSFVGHQLDRDCQNWLYPAMWRGWAATKTWQVWGALPWPRPRGEAALHAAAAGAESSPPGGASGDATAAPAHPACAKCGAGAADWAWTARDVAGQALCDACGDVLAREAEAAAAAWLADKAPSEQPDAKRRRVEGSAGGAACEAQWSGRPDHDADGDAAGDARTEDWLAANWWYRHTQDVIDLDEGPEAARVDEAEEEPAQSEEGLPLELQALCAIVGEVDPLLRPVRAGTILVGMDSLRIARLSLAIRTRLGRVLSGPRLREGKTVAELAAIVASADETPLATGKGQEGLAQDDAGREYAVWFSPGQYSAMGQWVHRTDDPLDHAAMIRATQRLVERHAALRVQIADTMRWMSFVYDAATLFSLYGPLLHSARAAPARLAQRALSWAFIKVWPRIRCFTREELYRERFPEYAAPLEIVRCTEGQERFERELKWRRSTMVPPGKICAYEVVCHLEDVWVFYKWRGSFAIVAAPAVLAGTGASLAYVDVGSGEWGPLLNPCSARWKHPPYGFPAAFFVPLSNGACVWLRLERADELRVHYRESASPGAAQHHMIAHRAAPKRDKGARPPTVISFVTIAMWHAFADGNCHLPLSQDLFAFYDEARGRQAFPPPPIGNPLAELEQRLFDTFRLRTSPMRASLRGSIWQHRGKGYGHIIGLAPGAMAVITRRAAFFRVPVDVVLMALVVCAMARADAREVLDYTLYSPMRDGLSDSMSVGLFADWRVLRLMVDFELATVLGTVLQVNHKLQHRQWNVFNALDKPEAVVVNIQPLDFTERSGFMNLGENMWRDGDQLFKEPEQRSNEMKWAQQPASFVIEQQDQDTWWILASAAHDQRPLPWMRRFEFGVREAVHAFCHDPLARVHLPLPSDGELLRRYGRRIANAR